MPAVLLLCALLPFHASAAMPAPAAVLPAAMTAADAATLRKRLMDRADAMGRAQQGVFNDDVTAMVSPFFPAGQAIADTEATLRQQKLGALLPYRGKVGPADGTMFASRVELMSQTFDNLYVVLHFSYRHAPDGALLLDHMRAFLRSQTM